MAGTTGIEWTDATWQPITGCSILSPGCTHCYAMKLAGGRLRNHPSRKGLTKPSKNGPVWTGEVRFNEQWLKQPLSWREPKMIFVCAHGDLFHESIPDEWIDKVFAVMALCPQHTFRVLTKRAERLREYLRANDAKDGIDARDRVQGQMWGITMCRTDHFHGGWPLRNVWLGVSTERQQEADERIPHLLRTPAAVRFISAEPLLGQIDLTRWMPSGKWGRAPVTGAPVHHQTYFMTECEHCGWFGSSELVNLSHNWDDADCVCPSCNKIFLCDDFGTGAGVTWVIVGGESGKAARPMHPDWARSLRDQCAAAGVPFFYKQWGEWIGAGQVADARGITPGAETLHRWPDGAISSRLGKKAAGRLLDGKEHNAFPDTSAKARAA